MALLSIFLLILLAVAIEILIVLPVKQNKDVNLCTWLLKFLQGKHNNHDSR